jgi:hypothetical protein
VIAGHPTYLADDRPAAMGWALVSLSPPAMSRNDLWPLE